MPELPEVQQFCELLIPLISMSSVLHISCTSTTQLKKTFLSLEELESLSGNFFVKDVRRKGKLLCLVLSALDHGSNNCMHTTTEDTKYLYMHMGMTGRISTPTCVPKLESLKNDHSYPPPHTHLILTSNGYEVAFSDPRRFGAVFVSSTTASLEELAPDGLDSTSTLSSFEGLIGKRKGVKSLLLDQRAVVSGVGNWVADEVLYQSAIHPDQTYLSKDEVEILRSTLNNVLITAVNCYRSQQDFPSNWLFHYRWNKSKSKGSVVKDSKGRKIVFVTSGGRTSATVPSAQKKKSRSLGGMQEEITSTVALSETCVEKEHQSMNRKTDTLSVVRRSKRIKI